MTTTWSDYPVREYVTEISVPDFGDGGIQRLHSRPLEGKGEKDMPETGPDAGAKNRTPAAEVSTGEPETGPEPGQ
jgi:hypothetical protein